MRFMLDHSETWKALVNYLLVFNSIDNALQDI